MISVKGISKSFGKKKAIENISLDVNAGEIVCLLGPSGAGKTTLIRLITGAIKADSGEITIGGIKVPSIKLYAEMGFMPQSDALYTDLSGLDNLLFFGGLYRMKGQALKQRAFDVLEMLGLFPDKGKLVAHYSGGMKKRLSLAAALLHGPKFLLLDEPTVGIDPILRQTIWEQFRKLSAHGVSVIVSTHVMDEAEKCNRTALIYNGLLVANDTTENLLAKTPNRNIEELFFMARGAQL